MVKIKGDLSMFIYLAMIDSPEEKLKFEIIYERYKGLMFYTANSVLGDTRDSEDIVHDAFLKIIEIIDEIDDPKSPQTRYLIVTITENKAIDLYRKRKAKTVVVPSINKGIAGVPSRFMRKIVCRLRLSEVSRQYPERSLYYGKTPTIQPFPVMLQ